ncbi:MAG: nicotinate-nucleotide--dimethylbenzimidazole phosphoribosyltransferase [Clostridiales bacterium]|jgi:nicotinate-nucleotide--dimethylbenzimidazole phosphoribosyltransferase|nr:nicotinate-nucleotide--dimethylbenzimidazole phosphoribosyltransferase [Clostridiales bacterium]
MSNSEKTLPELSESISRVKGLDKEALQKARQRADSLVKPPGSLGRLEEIAVQLAGISGEVFYRPDKRCVVIMASDNGVVEEGVASAPQSVTHTQTLNFIKGITGVAVLAKAYNAGLMVADLGINADVDYRAILNRKIRKSTRNIAKGPAMSREEAERAVMTGIELAARAVHEGNKMLGAGEMGIGNTTTTAAVLCALTGAAPAQAAGKGAGLKEEAYRHKLGVIETALRVNAPDSSDPIDCLAKVGGFDIAALAGLYIGGAISRVPVVIDGFISMVAALAAYKLCPLARDYMIPSHASFEQGFSRAAEALGVEPYLNLNMRLGEGSGCPIMFGVIDAACAVLRDMGTFEEASIGEEYIDAVKEGDNFTVVSQ